MGIEHAEGSQTGASGGSVYWQSWTPDWPKAVVLLAHGLAEHSGRYTHVATRLADAGFAVYAIDHQGHGKSSGTKGNIGRMAWVLKDFDALRDRAKAAHPQLPLFAVGHSLGGLIVLDYALTHGEAGLAGMALSGAAVDPTVGTPLERKVAAVLGRVAPNFGVLELGAEHISRDPEVVRAYREDPLVHNGKVRARTGSESLSAVSRVAATLPNLTLPVLVMHGTEDKLAAPSGAAMISDTIGSADVTVKLYEGLYHEIFNEPEQDEVLADLVGWLDARH